MTRSVPTARVARASEGRRNGAPSISLLLGSRGDPGRGRLEPLQVRRPDRGVEAHLHLAARRAPGRRRWVLCFVRSDCLASGCCCGVADLKLDGRGRRRRPEAPGWSVRSTSAARCRAHPAPGYLGRRTAGVPDDPNSPGPGAPSRAFFAIATQCRYRACHCDPLQQIAPLSGLRSRFSAIELLWSKSFTIEKYSVCSENYREINVCSLKLV